MCLGVIHTSRLTLPRSSSAAMPWYPSPRKAGYRVLVKRSWAVSVLADDFQQGAVAGAERYRDGVIRQPLKYLPIS